MAQGHDVVRRLIAALDDHDAAAVIDLMTDDVEYTDWRSDRWRTVVGRTEVAEVVEAFDRDLSSDFTVSPTFVVVDDQGFAVEYAEVGTQDRGDDPTGRRFSLRNVMIGALRDGRISRLTDHSDVVAFRSQMAEYTTDGENEGRPDRTERT